MNQVKRWGGVIDKIIGQNKNRAEHVSLVEAKQSKWVALTDTFIKDAGF